MWTGTIARLVGIALGVGLFLTEPATAEADQLICSSGACIGDCGHAEDACSSGNPNCHAYGCMWDGATQGCVAWQALCAQS